MFFALAFNVYRVQSDGIIYYRFLERLLNVANPENSASAVANAFFFQSGCAFFNAPFYLIAYNFEQIFNINFNFNGITLRQIAINLSSNFYMLLSLILTVKILKRLKLRNIIFPVISILFSTSAFVSASITPSFNHVTEIFVITLFLFLFLKNMQDDSPKTYWLGVLTVLAILVRYFNFVLIIPVALYYLRKNQYLKLKHLVLGFFATVWAIPLIFYCYNGTISPFYNTQYHNALIVKSISIGSVNFLPKYILKYLVHPLHGLFVWSPVTILSILGLSSLPKDKKMIGNVFLGIAFLYLFMLGFNKDWYAGWSFSNRYLTGFFAVYIVGLSTLLQSRKKWILLLAIITTAYSIILLMNWRLTIMQAEYDTPMGMVNAWIRGYSTSSIDKAVNIKTFFYRLWEMCRYKYIFRLF